ncbi:FAD-dependent oxidoreductase [Poseidonocella sp. HB161398]|uniref:flavin monoamine oxidase family protein n=1 Tax=Poseidonocella sp. HB161398 TaxID=2320855 RepID=UPI00110972FE|nr:FAD-dependent oxidoreductase [Poseidonocella sp. HB161398]
MNIESGHDADVIIVGAGLSGMTAAKDLAAAGQSVLVFDGKDRVGGRTWCDPSYPEGAIDFGGMFVGTTHSRSTALGLEMGLELVRARPEGAAVWDLGGTPLTAPDGYPERVLEDGTSLKDALAAAFAEVDRIAAEIGKDDPWNAPRAAELDAMTMQGWLDATVADPLARRIVGADVSIITGVDPSEISALFFAFYVAQCEDMHALQVTSNTLLWKGGAGQIADRIADRIGRSRLRLSEPVIAIDHAEDGATVTTMQGSYRARRLILALPPSAAAQIRFSPELPDARRQINRRTNFGRYMKLQIRFDRQFWLDKGLSGEIFSLNPGFFSLDVTRPDDAQATLVVFIGASAYDAWHGKGEEARRVEMLDALARCLGPDAMTPAAYVETPWNEVPFTMGGPVCHMPPGLLSTAGPALRAPIGAIHFAGTEAAPNWTGYMEGAVQSGEAAAAAIKATLKTGEPA